MKLEIHGLEDVRDLFQGLPAKLAAEMQRIHAEYQHPEVGPLSNMRAWLEGSEPLPSSAVLRASGMHRFGRPLLLAHREWFTGEFGFAVPSSDLVSALSAFGPLLEVGAGSGYLSRLLANAGVDVVATDSCRELYRFTVGQHFPVRRMYALAAARRWPDRAVLCSWPSYGKPWCAKMAASLAAGRVFALIGEPSEGCTGDRVLFKVLEQAFEPIGGLTIPQFPDLHNELTI